MKTSLYLQYFEKKNTRVPLIDRQNLLRSSSRRDTVAPNRRFLRKVPLAALGGMSLGDYLKVGFIFKEGDKKRIQFFEGIIIAINGSLFTKKITLLQPGTYGVERSFFCQSPQIQTLKILQSKKFRQSKLFFLRNYFSTRGTKAAAFGLRSSKKSF